MALRLQLLAQSVCNLVRLRLARVGLCRWRAARLLLVLVAICD
jgi:hypothetical protein